MNTVATARSLLRRHDARLKPFGVTVQQFALLAAIRFYPGVGLAALADRIGLDRTSLTRNLALLERKGLVQRMPAPHGNTRQFTLTATGDSLLDRLFEEWQASRDLLVGKGLSEADIATYLRVARHLG